MSVSVKSPYDEDNQAVAAAEEADPSSAVNKVGFISMLLFLFEGELHLSLSIFTFSFVLPSCALSPFFFFSVFVTVGLLQYEAQSGGDA